MKNFASKFVIALAVLVSITMSASAQTTVYGFKILIFPGETFTQTLGINNTGVIAGYHGATVNKGFTLVLPNHYTNQNFPGSAQTQVIGIDAMSDTVGFYIDAGGTTHGFLNNHGTFSTVDFPKNNL